MRTHFAATTAALALASPLTAQTSIGARAGMTFGALATNLPGESSSTTGIQLGATASFMGEAAGLMLSAAYNQR